MEALQIQFGSILKEALSGSLSSLFKIACIVIPLMIVLEFISEARVLDRIVEPMKGVVKGLGLPAAAAFPLLVGITFGLVYGSGLIIQYVEEGRLSKRENILLNIFLCICHGLIEDTLILAAIGAIAVYLLVPRIVAAILITRLSARLINPRYPVRTDLTE